MKERSSKFLNYNQKKMEEIKNASDARKESILQIQRENLDGFVKDVRRIIEDAQKEMQELADGLSKKSPDVDLSGELEARVERAFEIVEEQMNLMITNNKTWIKEILPEVEEKADMLKQEIKEGKQATRKLMGLGDQ